MSKGKFKKYKHIAIWVITASALLLCVGCQPRAPQVFKIGLVAPFEGADREIGYDGIYAARLAVREFNAVQADQDSTYRVALVALDDGSNAEIAAGNAQALARDPTIIAVVGMGNEATRLSMAENLAKTSIPFIHTGVFPFEPTNPASLPADFLQQYAEVTPFDEVAGPEAGSVFEAFELIFAGLDQLSKEDRPISAKSMAEILNSVKITGITGKTIYWEP